MRLELKSSDVELSSLFGHSWQLFMYKSCKTFGNFISAATRHEYRDRIGRI